MSTYGRSRVLHAVEVSRRAWSVLARSGVGRVHSVFHRCINITTRRGDWLTLCVVPFPRTPDGILVERLGAEHFQALGVVAGATVRIFEEVLSIPDADVALEAGHARLFDTKRERLAVAGREQQMRCNLEIARHTVIESGSEEGFGWIREALLAGNARHGYREQTLTAALCVRGGLAIEALLEGLRRNDRAVMRKGAAALMGLGLGSTPSGDDFLAGLAAALYERDGYDAFFGVLNGLLDEGGRTTDLCEQGYRRIAEGDIADVLYEPIRVIVECGEKAVHEAFMALLKQGNSSGTEMAIGICVGMALEGAPERRGDERSEFLPCL